MSINRKINIATVQIKQMIHEKHIQVTQYIYNVCIYAIYLLYIYTYSEPYIYAYVYQTINKILIIMYLLFHVVSSNVIINYTIIIYNSTSYNFSLSLYFFITFHFHIHIFHYFTYYYYL